MKTTLKQTIKTSLLLAAILSQAACYRMTISDAQSELEHPKIFVDMKEEGRWNHYVIGGIVPLKNGRVDQICDGNQDFESLHMRTSFLNQLLWSVSFNWYNPQSVHVICGTDSEENTEEMASDGEETTDAN